MTYTGTTPGKIRFGIDMTGLDLDSYEVEQTPLFKKTLVRFLKETFDLARATEVQAERFVSDGEQWKPQLIYFHESDEEEKRAKAVSDFVRDAGAAGRTYAVNLKPIEAGCSPDDDCYRYGTCPWDSRRAYAMQFSDGTGMRNLTADEVCDRYNAARDQLLAGDRPPAVNANAKLRDMKLVAYHSVQILIKADGTVA